MDHSLAVFAAAAFVTVASPGPTSLLALNNGARWGVRAALPGIAGAALSDLVLIAAVALGLGALLAATPWALEALRWAGAGILGWLGWQMMRSAARRLPVAAAAAPPLNALPSRVMLRSFGVAVSNPKGRLPCADLCRHRCSCAAVLCRGGSAGHRSLRALPRLLSKA